MSDETWASLVRANEDERRPLKVLGNASKGGLFHHLGDLRVLD
jgi:hypothetical protein